MERADRAPVGTFYAPGAWSAGDAVQLPEGAAHHALVRRFSVGDAVRLTSGDGRRAMGRITQLGKGRLAVTLDGESLEIITALPPIALWAPIGTFLQLTVQLRVQSGLGRTSNPD